MAISLGIYPIFRQTHMMNSDVDVFLPLRCKEDGILSLWVSWEFRNTKNVCQTDSYQLVSSNIAGMGMAALATEVSKSCLQNCWTQRNIFQQTSFDAHNEPGVFAWSVTARMFIGLACATHPARQQHLTISIGIKWPCLGLIVPTIGINLYWPHNGGLPTMWPVNWRKNPPSWDFQESKGDSDIEFFKDPEDLRLAATFICINLRASWMRLSSNLLKQHRTSISAWSSEPVAIEQFFFSSGHYLGTRHFYYPRISTSFNIQIPKSAEDDSRQGTRLFE